MTISYDGVRPMRPTHPGEMLREDFLPDAGVMPSGLATAIGVSRQTVQELLRERRALSVAMAWRLSVFFGTTPEFWLDAQRAVDLWDAARELRGDLEKITPFAVA